MWYILFNDCGSDSLMPVDGRKSRNINYLSVWHLIEYIEKHATIEQYQRLVVALYNKGSM